MKITLSKLKQVIKESIEKYLLTEMSKINDKEFYGYFPYNKFEIKIWSNDHNPPHFHVTSKDGWNIKVRIEDGEIEKIKRIGKNSQIQSYIEKNIKLWLNMRNTRFPKYTNREYAMKIWNKYN